MRILLVSDVNAVVVLLVALIRAEKCNCSASAYTDQTQQTVSKTHSEYKELLRLNRLPQWIEKVGSEDRILSERGQRGVVDKDWWRESSTGASLSMSAERSAVTSVCSSSNEPGTSMTPSLSCDSRRRSSAISCGFSECANRCADFST